MKTIVLDGVDPASLKIYVVIDKITHFYSYNGKTVIYFDSADNYITVEQSPEKIDVAISGQT